MLEPIIEVDGISKCFHLYENPAARLQHTLAVPLIGSRGSAAAQKWAVRDVSFSVKRGEAYGIIGCNGSGKSTLLKMICGVLRPTSGRSIVRGRILGLLELGAGLDPELSGRRNVTASTKLLGFPEGYAEARMEEIEAFADIGEFFDLPVKLYSSGMLVRLAFSLYLFLEPDVLVIDEALSVGDHFFQRKCAAAISKFRERGAAMLLVSHSLGTVRSMCDRAHLLEGGRVVIEGDVASVVAAYVRPRASNCEPPPKKLPSLAPRTSEAASTDPDEAQRVLTEINPTPPAPDSDWSVAGIRLVNATGGLAGLFEMGEQARLEIVLAAAAGTPLPSLTVEFVDRFDRVLSGRRAAIGQATRLPLGAGEAIVVVTDVTLNLYLGEYVARVLINDETANGAARSQPFNVYNRRPHPPFHGMVGLPATFRLDGRQAANPALPDVVVRT